MPWSSLPVAPRYLHQHCGRSETCAPYDKPHVPLYARFPSALHAASQSRTFVVPALVQIVIEPSPLHDARVPVQRGKHVSRTDEVEDVSSAQLALERASAHAPLTRRAVNCSWQSAIVTACLHSSISRVQSFSELIGRRPGVPPDDDDDELDVPDPELLEEELVDPVPGYGSQPPASDAIAAPSTTRRPRDRSVRARRILATSR